MTNKDEPGYYDGIFPEPMTVTFQEIGGRIDYSLIEVPLDSQLHMEYRKMSLGLDLNLTPVDLHYWNVEGSADPDLIDHFGLPVASKRQGRTPPVITEAELESIRQKFDGSISLIENDFNPDLLYVNLDLPVNYLYEFFHHVWRPSDSKRVLQAKIGMIYNLGDPINNIRRLPQKTPTERGKDQASLRVILDQAA